MLTANPLAVTQNNPKSIHRKDEISSLVIHIFVPFKQCWSTEIKSLFRNTVLLKISIVIEERGPVKAKRNPPFKEEGDEDTGS